MGDVEIGGKLTGIGDVSAVDLNKIDVSAATALELIRVNAGGTALESSGSAVSDFATAAQGATADSAVQPGGALGTPSSGTLTNCTGLPVAGGGTNATTAAGARTNLGLVIGTDVQAYAADARQFQLVGGANWVTPAGTRYAHFGHAGVVYTSALPIAVPMGFAGTFQTLTIYGQVALTAGQSIDWSVYNGRDAADSSAVSLASGASYNTATGSLGGLAFDATELCWIKAVVTGAGLATNNFTWTITGYRT